MKKVLMHVYVTGSVTEKWAVFLRILFFWDVILHLCVLGWKYFEGVYSYLQGFIVYRRIC